MSGTADPAAILERLQRLEDLEAIRDLMARYHAACDGDEASGTHRDPDAIAALFTEQGIYDMPGGPYVGRAAIADMARRLQSIVWILHFVANPILRISGDTATADFKGFVRSRATQGAEAAWSLGRYDADAVRTGEGWRFSRMRWTYADDAGTLDARLKRMIAR